ncbi:Protein of unknown function [Lactobacillus helveticus CIRM-BIA 951]|uniref:Uncharacterized protein n=1 Tax=Lactobacillus helveticus CIRM-BIA 951 TaxID=1226334 RepID=U6F7Z8_LACHE|nr:Protein of unknown function [Lactobacillus helveticus CIRM-BIA 951]
MIVAENKADVAQIASLIKLRQLLNKKLKSFNKLAF